MKKMNFAFWKYISLGIFGMIGSAGTILADAFFVSDRLGSTGLAAMNMAMCMFGLMNGTGLLFGIGGATRYTIASAQGNNVRANQVFASSFFTALFMGVAFALTGLLFSNPISYLLGANAETIIMCNIYLKTILCFAPAFVLNHLLMAFVRNDGNPVLSTCAMMVGSLANIVLDYLFMYPLGMGIFGAAVATGLAALIGISISCLHFLSGTNNLQFVRLKFNLKEIATVVSLGTSSFITEFSSSVVIMIYNLLILKKTGNTGVAAYGIVAKLGAVITFAPVLIRCFNGEGDITLQALAERGLRLYFIGFLFVGHNYLTAAYFSATEMPKQAFAIAFFRGFMGSVAIVCFLSMYFGMTGIWLAFPVVEVITVGLCLILQFKLNLSHRAVKLNMKCSEGRGEL